jgi:hypothetical protein
MRSHQRTAARLSLYNIVNLNVPSQQYILPFYFSVLGCGMDPRKADNLAPDAKKKTLWANCGASQFHLPYGDNAQRIPGKIGLRYNSLDGLKERLGSLAVVGDCVEKYEEKTTPSGEPCVEITDVYGNLFYCSQGGNPVSDQTWKQPFITPSETDINTWGEVAREYGRQETDCCGISFVEFKCPIGTAEQIALFYESVLDATTSVIDSDDGSKVAVIAFGNVDETGRADQSLLFRETSDDIPPYDGHHIAMYVGESAADFDQAFRNAEVAGVVWVNPRFSDKATDLQGARKWQQFRFKDILDMETGEPVFELEHEIRSVEHEAWPGSKLE